MEEEGKKRGGKEGKRRGGKEGGKFERKERRGEQGEGREST
jgi:hypothetical protein